MMGKKYIHYGSPTFDIEQFKPIKNKDLFTKPSGGLWASPIDATLGWKQWCENEDFNLGCLGTHFTFEIPFNAKRLYISYGEQLDNLPKVEPPIGMEHFDSWDLLDFEKLAKKYDCIEVNISGDTTKDYWKSLYHRLYGWDCDSILIMNPDIIQNVRGG